MEIGGVMIPAEVATMPGRGTLTITGQAGEVMQESARAALSEGTGAMFLLCG